jgi:IS30 family transposase
LPAVANTAVALATPNTPPTFWKVEPMPLARPSCPVRAEVVGQRAGWSPGQIAGRLKRDHPGRPELQVSHEKFYQALFVQGTGSLRAEVAVAVRCGRARRRRPRSRATEARGKITGMINISERAPGAADRAVPGHGEGDLVIGKDAQSAVATLAERTTRYCMIIALPGGRTADAVSAAGRRIRWTCAVVRPGFSLDGFLASTQLDLAPFGTPHH